MAGVKITDLTPLITPVASDDLLYIVDVSDTTESPEGTSKSIEVGNLFESGTWTPVFSSPTNACSNAVAVKGLYNRIGNIVTCTIYGYSDFNFSVDNFGSFYTTLPISPVTLNAIGTLSIDLANPIMGFMNNDFISFKSNDTSFIGFNVYFVSVIQYEIN